MRAWEKVQLGERCRIADLSGRGERHIAWLHEMQAACKECHSGDANREGDYSRHIASSPEPTVSQMSLHNLPTYDALPPKLTRPRRRFGLFNYRQLQPHSNHLVSPTPVSVLVAVRHEGLGPWDTTESEDAPLLPESSCRNHDSKRHMRTLKQG